MIRKVLIANRGEIAIRISYTLREMGIDAAAVFTAADEGALHARLAREAHLVISYLDIDEMIRTATDAAADAVHPGYGFLSENAALSAACAEAGIVFIGPAPETIRKMGDKLESKRVMQEAGVPVVPIWAGEPPDSEYPVLVKAAGGSGGIGGRACRQIPWRRNGRICSRSRGPILLPRDEHPIAGRTSGDRDDDGIGSGPRTSADRIRRKVAVPAGRSAANRPLHRVPCLCRDSRGKFSTLDWKNRNL